VLEPGRGSNDVPNGSDQADQLVRQCVASAREVAARGVLLRVTFETLFEYMTVQPRAGLGARQCSLDAGQRTVSLHPLSCSSISAVHKLSCTQWLVWHWEARALRNRERLTLGWPACAHAPLAAAVYASCLNI